MKHKTPLVLSATGITTAELSQRIGVLTTSIRTSLSAKGSYRGVMPVRLPNGQLRWPEDAPSKVLAQMGA
jgi:hypothetical protein